jgi:hypothetical protein
MDVLSPNPSVERTHAHHKHGQISMGYNLATTIIERSEVQMYNYEVKVKMKYWMKMVNLQANFTNQSLHTHAQQLGKNSSESGLMVTKSFT